MPLTFVDIERRKTWRISLLFIMLLFLYACIGIALVQSFFLIFPFVFLKNGSWSICLGGSTVLKVLVSAFVLAGVHFFFSSYGAVRKVIEALGATPPDREDGIHRRLLNIVDEIHIVTGNRRKIDCYVVPTLSLNALAVADIRGEAAIAVTEGLLSRLSRPQLEAVIAHEACHILSDDCIETTVTASLFGVYASIMEKLTNRNDQIRGFHPAFILFWLLLRMSQLLNLFISREREYRADAASVGMTRNPLAMAEALRVLSRSWTGMGYISSGLEMLCIVPPETTDLDESETWLADLFSTHPPTRKRIAVLLRMAHTGLQAFLATEEKKDATAGPARKAYYARDPSRRWAGPFGLPELIGLTWLTPSTWISTGTPDSIERVSENSAVSEAIKARPGVRPQGNLSFACPSCRQPLTQVPYERTRVFRCAFCGGILVESDKLPRILARCEEPCTDRTKALARAVIADNQRTITTKLMHGKTALSASVLTCPKCRNLMFRTFYSLAYLIEIDRCNICGLTWFDKDELDMLQYLVENKITAHLDVGDSGV
jgi:heat shock protein HtpX